MAARFAALQRKSLFYQAGAMIPDFRETLHGRKYLPGIVPA
jgi:hypothetical protein